MEGVIYEQSHYKQKKTLKNIYYTFSSYYRMGISKIKSKDEEQEWESTDSQVQTHLLKLKNIISGHSFNLIFFLNIILTNLIRFNNNNNYDDNDTLMNNHNIASHTKEITLFLPVCDNE